MFVLWRGFGASVIDKSAFARMFATTSCMKTSKLTGCPCPWTHWKSFSKSLRASVYKFISSPWSFRLAVSPLIRSRNGIELTNARPTRHNNDDKVGEPTWIFSCTLSLILSASRAPGQQKAKQQPSPILDEMSHSKHDAQKIPMQTANWTRHGTFF